MGIWNRRTAIAAVDGATLSPTGEPAGLRPSPTVPGPPGDREGRLAVVAHRGMPMAWFDSMPDDDITAIAYLRKQLDTATDPLHRHFAFNELERRLYKCRHAFASALTEFDHTCESHDSEMTTIRPALVDAVGAVPFLPTYRQASIRHLNARDLRAAARWTVLGIAAYADQPVDPADLQDLDDRLARLQVDGRALADGEWR